MDKQAAKGDDRIEYDVRPGIDRLNGQKLRGARSVKLHPREAGYLLQICQIAPKGKRPAAWAAPAKSADA